MAGGLNLGGLKQMPIVPGVFCADEVRLAEHLTGPRRKIIQMADRRSNKVESRLYFRHEPDTIQAEGPSKRSVGGDASAGLSAVPRPGSLRP